MSCHVNISLTLFVSIIVTIFNCIKYNYIIDSSFATISIRQFYQKKKDTISLR